ncbi:MAG: DUF4293 domain-containing protein [Prolixibacteraceae bacterium]|nr:DUF4293 domain-containing protein [Prolixibacteraceae bacterium]
MLQRIQTFYLALGLILLGLMTALPWGEIVSGDLIYTFSFTGIIETGSKEIYNMAWHVMILLGIIILIQFVTIFLYKKRILQMRFATYNIIIMAGFLILCWFYVRANIKLMDEPVVSFKVVLAFPLVVGILNYLAIRAIGRDEALVRSVDRIR